jgi:hypothetical protein
MKMCGGVDAESRTFLTSAVDVLFLPGKKLSMYTGYDVGWAPKSCSDAVRKGKHKLCQMGRDVRY